MCARAGVAAARNGPIGTDIRYATFFPAVLLTGLLAGTPAAVGATLASALIAYWAFMPPFYQFHAPTREMIIALAIWFVTAGLVILFTHYGRLLLKRVRSAEQEHEMIAKELEHRGRNTYAVIQSIVGQTLDDQPERADSILGRIRAVKFANDLVLNRLAHSTFLDAILTYEFAPYGEGRYVGIGPEVELHPETARFVVLLVHELVTNAAKHGALAVPTGKVDITWHIKEDRLLLQWMETGGRPLLASPARKGFGSKLIEQCLKALSGEMQQDFPLQGFSCYMSFRLPCRK